MMSTRTRGATAALALAGALAWVHTTPARTPQQPPAGQPIRVNEDARLAAEFTRRVQDYVALHQKLEKQLPSLSKEATPTDIDKHQRALGNMIEKARPQAQPGDIFTKEIRAYFRRQLAAIFKGQDGRQLRAAIMDENPGPIKLRVNARYPDTIPLSTMPPPLFAALPKLPEEVEYRFIGERLILLDVHAHIVIDYVEDALPK